MKQIFKGTINTENSSEHFNNASEYHSRVNELLMSGEPFECSSNIVVDGEPVKSTNTSCTLDSNWDSNLVSINATPYFESNVVDYKEESLYDIIMTMEKLHKHLDEILSHCSNEELEKYYQEVTGIIRELNDSYDDYCETYENVLTQIKSTRDLIKQYGELIDRCKIDVEDLEYKHIKLSSYREKTKTLLESYKRVERKIVDAGVAQFEDELKNCVEHNRAEHKCKCDCAEHKCCENCNGDCDNCKDHDNHDNCENCKEPDLNIGDTEVDFSELEKLIEDLFKDIDDDYLKKLKDLREKNTTKEEKYDFVKELEKFFGNIY